MYAWRPFIALLISQISALTVNMEKARVVELVMDTLSMFGEPSKKAIVATLCKQGIVFTPDSFDLAAFCSELRKLIGRGSETVINAVYQKLRAQHGALVFEKMESGEAALAVSSVVVARQKLGGLHGKTYAAVCVGIAFWFAAESIWSYYELGLGEEVPFPSLADAFWLAGYVPFAYHLFATNRFFSSSAKEASRLSGGPPQPPSITRAAVATVAAISAAAGTLLAFIVWLMLQSSDLGTAEGIAGFAIGAAYPVADMILLVPAVLVLLVVRGGAFTYTPWLLLSLSMITIVVADIGFAYYTAAGSDSDVWMLSALYSASYLAMAAALVWHNRFFIYDEKGALNQWRKEHR